MTKHLLISVIATGIVILGLGGCAPGNDRENGTRMSTHARNERALATPEQASIGVRKLLYERNLIDDPEVNRKMKEAVLRIAHDGAPSDSVMPDLYRWLEDWAATHPAQVDAARLAGGGYSAEARRVYVDTDSSRKAQTDSIRRLVRERARRRIGHASVAVDSAITAK
jgi:hypothetical protein